MAETTENQKRAHTAEHKGFHAGMPMGLLLIGVVVLPCFAVLSALLFHSVWLTVLWLALTVIDLIGFIIAARCHGDLVTVRRSKDKSR